MQNFRKKREVKLGILITVALFIFVWGINYLRGTDIFTPQIRFHIVYEDVTGLMETNPVTINGVNVGQVHRIAFHPDGSGKVVVTATVDRQIDIPVNSMARLTSEIVGTNKIVVALGDHQELISSGDTLTGIKEPGMTEQIEAQIGPVRDQAVRLMGQADTLLVALNDILREENRERITAGMESFEITMKQMESTATQLDRTMSAELNRFSRIMEHAEAILHNLDDNQEVINHILENISDVSDQFTSDEFQQTISQANFAITELSIILEKINEGEGSAGMLIQDESLYHNLSNASDELEKLLEDIRKHPGRYFRISVFGR